MESNMIPFEEYLLTDVQILKEGVSSIGDIKKSIKVIRKHVNNLTKLADEWINSLNESVITIDNWKDAISNTYIQLRSILLRYNSVKNNTTMQPNVKKQILTDLKEIITELDNDYRKFLKVKSQIFDHKDIKSLDNFINQLWSRVKTDYNLTNDKSNSTSSIESIKLKIIGTLSLYK